jgi:MtN3 and saliva related transmembrane protein
MIDTTTIVGLLAGAVMTSSTAPQIIQAIRSRRTDDISPTFFILTTMGTALWFAYGFLRADPVMLLWNGIALFLNAGMLLITVTYKQTPGGANA